MQIHISFNVIKKIQAYVRKLFLPCKHHRNHYTLHILYILRNFALFNLLRMRKNPRSDRQMTTRKAKTKKKLGRIADSKEKGAHSGKLVRNRGDFR